MSKIIIVQKIRLHRAKGEIVACACPYTSEQDLTQKAKRLALKKSSRRFNTGLFGKYLINVIEENFMKSNNNPEITEKRVAEEIWLNYFNRYLHSRGIITDKEFQIMVEKISVFCSKRNPPP